MLDGAANLCAGCMADLPRLIAWLLQHATPKSQIHPHGRFRPALRHRASFQDAFGDIIPDRGTLMPPTKEQTAQMLADAHFQVDPTITRIFRVEAPNESASLVPVKLLEVSSSTPELGISPVGMAADPAHGIFYSSIIIEITPRELERLNNREMSLPHDWRLGAELYRTKTVSGAAG
jgi:hypothetical protein